HEKRSGVREALEIATHSGDALHPRGMRPLSWTPLCRKVPISRDEVCLERRIARDVRERGRTRQSVLQQYQATVRPMCERFVMPVRVYADVVIRGDWPLAESAMRILAHASQPGGIAGAASPA
ncbi:MAG: uridine kinase, partial [Bryobacteraceae bacterium]